VMQLVKKKNTKICTIKYYTKIIVSVDKKIIPQRNTNCAHSSQVENMRSNDKKIMY
jgi:hypothetical protein